MLYGKCGCIILSILVALGASSEITPVDKEKKVLFKGSENTFDDADTAIIAGLRPDEAAAIQYIADSREVLALKELQDGWNKLTLATRVLISNHPKDYIRVKPYGPPELGLAMVEVSRSINSQDDPNASRLLSRVIGGGICQWIWGFRNARIYGSDMTLKNKIIELEQSIHNLFGVQWNCIEEQHDVCLHRVKTLTIMVDELEQELAVCKGRQNDTQLPSPTTNPDNTMMQYPNKTTLVCSGCLTSTMASNNGTMFMYLDSNAIQIRLEVARRQLKQAKEDLSRAEETKIIEKKQEWMRKRYCEQLRLVEEKLIKAETTPKPYILTGW
jgi:hypothetical protein